MQIKTLNDWLEQNPFGHSISAESIKSQLASNAGWEPLFRSLVHYSKQLPNFSDSMREEASEIKGCENQVWLLHQRKGEKHFFALDSNARITKGILAVILAFFQGKEKDQVSQEELQRYLRDTGLTPFLSPSRNNGVNAIVDAIYKVFEH